MVENYLKPLFKLLAQDETSDADISKLAEAIYPTVNKELEDLHSQKIIVDELLKRFPKPPNQGE